MFNPNRFCCFVVALIFVHSMISQFVSGGLCTPSFPDLGFDAIRASQLHMKLTEAPRYIGSDHWRKSMRMIEDELRDRPNLIVSVSGGDLGVCTDGKMCQIERGIVNVVARHDVPESNVEPLVFSAHVDSHPNTVGSYDDGINVAVMLALATSDFVSHSAVPITFVFLGSEEHEMHGARLLMSNASTWVRGNVFNLESMGTGRPFAIVTKAARSAATIKAFARVPGAIIATFFNDITSSRNFTSDSDLTIYGRHGLSGAQAVFLGHSTHYHTKHDHGTSLDDIMMEGNMLMGTISKYTGERGGDVVGFGISPFVIVLDRFIYQQLAVTTAVVAIVCCIYEGSFCAFLRVNIGMIAVIVCFVGLGMLLRCVNSVSIAQHQLLSFAILSFMGCAIMSCAAGDSQFTKETAVSYASCHLAVDTLLMLLTINFDISILFWLAIIPQLVSFMLKNWYWKCICAFMAFLPVSYCVALTHALLLGYVSQLASVVADLAPMLLIAFWSISCGMFFVPLSFGKRRSMVISTFRIFVVLFTVAATCFVVFKPYPYSSDYLLVGTEAEVVYENLSSVIYFVPLAGRRVSTSIYRQLRDPVIAYETDFQGYLHKRGPAFVARSNMTTITWPNFTITESNNIVTFNAGHVTPDIQSITLVVKCNQTRCVRDVFDLDNPGYKATEFGPNTCALRFSPVKSNLTIRLVLQHIQSIEMDVLYTTSTISPARRSFHDSLGPFTQHFSKDRFFGDTIYLTTTTTSLSSII